MRRASSILLMIALLASSALPAYPPVNYAYTDSQAPREIRWPAKTIKISLSTALNNPGSNIKIGSDVVGAAQRAFERWSTMTDLKFEFTESASQSISPGGAGDGVSLITIADTPQNNTIFAGGSMTGKTRIFYDPESGAIAEADIVINPHPISSEGLPVQFSTDGTPGTYDLESTFTHEIGHLLGLDHSPVVASTMHGQQALNGLYNQRAFSERTLSEDDRSRVRDLYGSDNGGTIEGRVYRPLANGGSAGVAGAPIWIEESHSGKLIASTLTSTDGSYRIENLPAGSYRVGSSASKPESPKAVSQNGNANPHTIDLGQATIGTVDVVATQFSSNRFLNPRLLGANAQLSTMPVVATAGQKIRVYVAGEGLEQVTAAGLSITSPYFKVRSDSITAETFRTQLPVISFEVTVAANVPFGDYSIRLESQSGHVAYLPGAITIDPGMDLAIANPADDARFFVKQHYRDLLGREPDEAGMEYWVEQLEQCGEDLACIRERRVALSAAFLNEPEFQRTSTFIYQLFLTGLGRRPQFAEFMSAREKLGRAQTIEKDKKALSLDFVQRAEFKKLYSERMDGKEFLDALLNSIVQNTNIDLTTEQPDLVKLYDGSNAGRAEIITRLADHTAVTNAERDKTFVLMQYFGFFLRDPNEGDIKTWLRALESKPANDPNRYASMVCSFVNSAEYQSRFGMAVTRSVKECGK